MSKRQNVAVVDYGAGNLGSLIGALETIGVDFIVVDNPQDLEHAKRVVLPGVGSYAAAMERLMARSLVPALRTLPDKGVPLLGICLGMQLLLSGSSEDGGVQGIGLANGWCERLTSAGSGVNRVPHVGFNAIQLIGFNGLFERVPTGGDFYFAHSYAVRHLTATDSWKGYGTTAHSEPFISTFSSKTGVYGVQFHPELSQGNGLLVLANFCSQVIR